MTIKYIYSPIRQKMAYPRIVKINDWGIEQLTPKSDRGSGVRLGRIIDTGNLYSSVEKLAEERHYDSRPVLAEKEFEYQGYVYMSNYTDSYHAYDVAFRHRVRKPGMHYLIEYKYGSLKSGRNHVEDFSPMYETFEEAIAQVQQHVASRVNDLNDNQYELEINDDKSFTRVVYSSYDENGETPYDATVSDYQIIPYMVTEEIYDEATDIYDDYHLIISSWNHFERPKYTYPSTIKESIQ